MSMKINKINIVVLVIVFAIGNVLVYNKIISKSFTIEKNIVERNKFRNPYINEKVLKELKENSLNSNRDFSEFITANYLLNDYSLRKTQVDGNNIKRIRKQFVFNNKEEYYKLLKAFSAIYDDLKYFPVAKGRNTNYWVGYENGFGESRNFMGKYKHEGCDIMAENNVSGFYPIISSTDGIVENIGWLPKGGYRVGIRSDNGGYFYYAHLSCYSNIKKGAVVKAGTLLGYMGNTGYGSIGTEGKFDVHLHFGIYIKTDNYEELSVNTYYILKYLENCILYANYWKEMSQSLKN